MGTIPSIRESLSRQLRPAANVGAELGVQSSQLEDLLAGRDVLVHRNQLDEHNLGASNLLADIGIHPSTSEWWTLTGANTLEPAA